MRINVPETFEICTSINVIWSPLSKHFFFCCSIVLARQWCVLQFFLKPQGYVYNLLKDFWHIKQNTDKPIIFLSKAIIILNCHINDTSANFSCATSMTVIHNISKFSHKCKKVIHRYNFLSFLEYNAFDKYT